MKRLMIVLLTAVTLIGAVQARYTYNPRSPYLFGVFNRTPHTIYVRMGFNKKKCAAMTKEIPAGGAAYAEHKGCRAVIVSGYIYIDGKQIDLDRWEAVERTTYPPSWKVEMNPDGKTATVHHVLVGDAKLEEFYRAEYTARQGYRN